jgi:hypothetical protein
MCHAEWPGVLFHLVYSVFVQKEGSITCFEVAFHPIKHVASRPRFGGDSQALSWSIPAEMRPSWMGTSWKGSAGQGPAIPDETGTRLREFHYIYKYQVVF